MPYKYIFIRLFYIAARCVSNSCNASSVSCQTCAFNRNALIESIAGPSDESSWPRTRAALPAVAALTPPPCTNACDAVRIGGCLDLTKNRMALRSVSWMSYQQARHQGVSFCVCLRFTPCTYIDVR